MQLSLVRRVLGGGIIADRDSVRLDLEVVSLDLARLRQAVIDRNWEEVVTIHCGEFLPEDAYEFWAQAPRERARTAYVSALGILAVAATDRGDHGRTIDLAYRVLEVDRFDSTAHRHLIGALTECGRHGEARRADRRYRALMSELEGDTAS